MMKWSVVAIALALVFMAILMLFSPGAVAAVPAPPFKTSWRCPVQSQIFSLAVAGTTAYFGTHNSFGAMDIATGKLIWQTPAPEGSYLPQLEIDGKTLYAAFPKYKVIACDPATGKPLWSLSVTCYSSPPAICGDLIICNLRPGILDAVDVRTHKSVWSYDLYKGIKASGKNRDGWEPRPLIRSGRLYVGSYNGRILCFEPTTGRLLWSAGAKPGRSLGAITSLAADDYRAYAAGQGGAAAFDPATGRELWHGNAAISRGGSLTLAGDKLLFADYGGPLHAYAADDGKELWHAELANDDIIIVSPPVVCGDLALVTVRSRILAFDIKSGKQVWDWDTQEELYRDPLYVTNDGFLATTSDGGDTVSGGFVMLVTGDPQRRELTAQERVELARTLAAKLGNMSFKEEKQFCVLGKDAADAVLPIFIERAAAYDRNPEVEGKQLTDAQNKARDQFLEAAWSLEKVMTPDQTPRMLELLDIYKDEWVRRWVTSIVAKRGDTKLAAPVFFRMLVSGPPDALSDEAQEVIWSSGLPEVTDYLVKLIKHPKADQRTRWWAYVNAARTGNDKAVDAILSVANTRRTIPTIAQMMCVDKMSLQVAKPGIECDNPACNSWIKLSDKKKDRHGVLWGLVSCAIIGTPDDLWIVRYDGKHWTAPLFTGMTRKELGKSDWLRKFAGNPALSRDSDKDGWTDLIEKRLGTNPHRADSDGDGIKDSQDMNPLTASRQLSEQDQILQAAFEAMHQFSGGACTPCIVRLPKQTKPFEVYNWGWITVPEVSGGKTPLSKYAGKGIGSVGFNQPERGFSGEPIRTRWSSSPILFNNDHTEAIVEVSTIYAPLAGTGYDIRLKKIRGRWFVVKAQMAWIS